MYLLIKENKVFSPMFGKEFEVLEIFFLPW